MITTRRSGREYLIVDSERGQIGVARRCSNPKGFAVSLAGIYWSIVYWPTRKGGRAAVVIKRLKDVPLFVEHTFEQLGRYPE